MKIELNKKYVTRCGDILKCFYIGKLGNYECVCHNETNNALATYMLDGKYQPNYENDPYDIVKEYKEPKEETVYIVMYECGSIGWTYNKETIADARKAICIRKVMLKEGEFDQL